MTIISFQKIITVLPDKIMPYMIRYKEIEKILEYKEIQISVCEGHKKKVLKKLESLGYKIIKIICEGEEKHHLTKMILAL